MRKDAKAKFSFLLSLFFLILLSSISSIPVVILVSAQSNNNNITTTTTNDNGISTTATWETTFSTVDSSSTSISQPPQISSSTTSTSSQNNNNNSNTSNDNETTTTTTIPSPSNNNNTNNNNGDDLVNFTSPGFSPEIQNQLLTIASATAITAGLLSSPTAAMSLQRGMAVFSLSGCPIANTDKVRWSRASLTFPRSFFPGSEAGNEYGSHARAAVAGFVFFGPVVVVLIIFCWWTFEKRKLIFVSNNNNNIKEETKVDAVVENSKDKKEDEENSERKENSAQEEKEQEKESSETKTQKTSSSSYSFSDIFAFLCLTSPLPYGIMFYLCQIGGFLATACGLISSISSSGNGEKGDGIFVDVIILTVIPFIGIVFLFGYFCYCMKETVLWFAVSSEKELKKIKKQRQKEMKKKAKENKKLKLKQKSKKNSKEEEKEGEVKTKTEVEIDSKTKQQQQTESENEEEDDEVPPLPSGQLGVINSKFIVVPTPGEYEWFYNVKVKIADFLETPCGRFWISGYFSWRAISETDEKSHEKSENIENNKNSSSSAAAAASTSSPSRIENTSSTTIEKKSNQQQQHQEKKLFYFLPYRKFWEEKEKPFYETQSHYTLTNFRSILTKMLGPLLPGEKSKCSSELQEISLRRQRYAPFCFPILFLLTCIASMAEGIAKADMNKNCSGSLVVLVIVNCVVALYSLLLRPFVVPVRNVSNGVMDIFIAFSSIMALVIATSSSDVGSNTGIMIVQIVTSIAVTVGTLIEMLLTVTRNFLFFVLNIKICSTEEHKQIMKEIQKKEIVDRQKSSSSSPKQKHKHHHHHQNDKNNNNNIDHATSHTQLLHSDEQDQDQDQEEELRLLSTPQEKDNSLSLDVSPIAINNNNNNDKKKREDFDDQPERRFLLESFLSTSNSPSPNNNNNNNSPSPSSVSPQYSPQQKETKSFAPTLSRQLEVEINEAQKRAERIKKEMEIQEELEKQKKKREKQQQQQFNMNKNQQAILFNDDDSDENDDSLEQNNKNSLLYHKQQPENSNTNTNHFSPGSGFRLCSKLTKKQQEQFKSQQELYLASLVSQICMERERQARTQIRIDEADL